MTVLLGVVLGMVLVGLGQWSGGLSSDIKLQNKVDEADIVESKNDSLFAANAKGKLELQGRIIDVLKVELNVERAKNYQQRRAVKRAHLTTDSLRMRFDTLGTLNHSEQLVEGLGIELSAKDSLIKTQDAQLINYSKVQNAMDQKVEIQEGIILRKERLLEVKSSIIDFYRTEQKRREFWGDVKLKVLGAVLLIETIFLIAQ